MYHIFIVGDITYNNNIERFYDILDYYKNIKDI